MVKPEPSNSSVASAARVVSPCFSDVEDEQIDILCKLYEEGQMMTSGKPAARKPQRVVKQEAGFKQEAGVKHKSSPAPSNSGRSKRVKTEASSAGAVSTTAGRKPRAWTEEEDKYLLQGVKERRVGDWKLIFEAYPDIFVGRRPRDLQEHYRVLINNGTIPADFGRTSRLAVYEQKPRVPFALKEKIAIVLGLKKVGWDDDKKWKKILDMYPNVFHDKRLPINLKDCVRTMKKIKSDRLVGLSVFEDISELINSQTFPIDSIAHCGKGASIDLTIDQAPSSSCIDLTVD